MECCIPAARRRVGRGRRPATRSEDAIPRRSCRGCRRDMCAGSERHKCRPCRAQGPCAHGGSVGGVLILTSPALAGLSTVVRFDIVVRGPIVCRVDRGLLRTLRSVVESPVAPCISSASPAGLPEHARLPGRLPCQGLAPTMPPPCTAYLRYASLRRPHSPTRCVEPHLSSAPPCTPPPCMPLACTPHPCTPPACTPHPCTSSLHLLHAPRVLAPGTAATTPSPCAISMHRLLARTPCADHAASLRSLWVGASAQGGRRRGPAQLGGAGRRRVGPPESAQGGGAERVGAGRRPGGRASAQSGGAGLRRAGAARGGG